MKRRPDRKNLAVDDARRVQQSTGHDIIIVLSVDADGELQYASYGRDKNLCDVGRILADCAFNAVQTGFDAMVQAAAALQGEQS